MPQMQMFGHEVKGILPKNIIELSEDTIESLAENLLLNSNVHFKQKYSDVPTLVPKITIWKAINGNTGTEWSDTWVIIVDRLIRAWLDSPLQNFPVSGEVHLDKWGYRCTHADGCLFPYQL